MNLNKIYHIFEKLARQVIIFAVTAGVAAFVAAATPVQADVVGEHHNFFVDSHYDRFGRSSVPATLVTVGQHEYIYVEDAVVQSFGGISSHLLTDTVGQIASDFDNNIYPKDTAFWGSEPNPGIDNDPHITILFERLSNGTGGYTDTTNFYNTTGSNEREMISINSDTLSRDGAQVYLAHEFEHVISGNQKILLHGIVEDTWLDELRAQYSVSVTGYNTPFSGSDLQNRLRDFMDNPTDSVTEWKGTSLDYAPVTLLGQYLVEQYGPSILQDTLRSRTVGIDSINSWLSAHGYKEDFSTVFANWAVADYLNSTSIDKRWGYTDANLATIHVAPVDSSVLNYPSSQFSFFLKPWQPEWYKFIPPSNIPNGTNLKISWNAPNVSVDYLDATGRPQNLSSGQIIPPSGVFTLIPYNHPAGSSASADEPAADVSLTIEYVAQPIETPTPVATPATVIPDGSLIHLQGEPDMYVVAGKYIRYLSPAVIALYGQLDPSKAITVDQAKFNSYIVSNYVRDVNEQKVFAVWPDGTKHWLHMSAATFSSSGRDWNSIFIISDAESNFYKIGSDITN